MPASPIPCPQEPYSQWAASLRLAVLSGLRRSELLGLRWSTAHPKAGSLRIAQVLVEVHGRRPVPRLRVIAGGVLIASCHLFCAAACWPVPRRPFPDYRNNRAIITERWTVIEDVRGRRRNKKGKTPKTGEKRRHRRSGLPRSESLTNHPNNVNPNRDKHRLTPQPA